MANLPKFLAAGDRAIVVELGDSVDPQVNSLVVALDSVLAAKSVRGIIETVPTYRSLLIMFDPLVVSRTALREHVLSCWPLDPSSASRTYRRWTIPVLYGGEAGEDLAFVAQTHGLTSDQVIRLHSGAEYRVYMIGFAPGFGYLGGLPDVLHTSRRRDPRLRTPPGSVSIGGKQAAVGPPMELPSGWHLLGRTPVKTYDPGRDEPFLLTAGDHVKFEPIPDDAYRSLTKMAEGGELVARVETIHE